MPADEEQQSPSAVQVAAVEADVGLVGVLFDWFHQIARDLA